MNIITMHRCRMIEWIIWEGHHIVKVVDQAIKLI